MIISAITQRSPFLSPTFPFKWKERHVRVSIQHYCWEKEKCGEFQFFLFDLWTAATDLEQHPHFRWSSVCILCCFLLMFFPSRFSAGAGRTGTFIALSNILERVKAEGLLDVFQTVKSLRMQRPHMVQTVVGTERILIAGFFTFVHKCAIMIFLFCFYFQEQYDFCYRVVQDFVDIFSDYANFKWCLTAYLWQIILCIFPLNVIF